MESPKTKNEDAESDMDEKNSSREQIKRVHEILNNNMGVYESNAIIYFAEVIARYVVRKFKACNFCRQAMIREEDEPSDKSKFYLQLREYVNKDRTKDAVKN